MEIQLTKNARAVANAAATEESRPVLTALNFEKGEIQAANGYVLARRKVEGLGKGKSFMLPAAQILKTKDIKTLGYALLQIGNGNSKAGTLTGEDMIKSTIEKIDAGNYPAVDRLMPKKTAKPQVEIRLGVDILKTLIKVAGTAKSIDFKIYGPTEAVYFECIDPDDGPNTYGLAMPKMKG